MFDVTILGNNSALPMHDRHPTAQVLTVDDQAMLIDCGEGTQVQMNRFKIRRSRISHIFISHLHGDHYFGLFGLLNSFSLVNRKEDLHLFAPPGLKAILDQVLENAETQLSYNLFFHPLENPGLLYEGRRLTVHCFPVHHRIQCWGFLFRERDKLRKVDVGMCRDMGVPESYYPKLKLGQDYQRQDGSIVPCERVTRPAPHARSYAFCADTRFEPSLAETVRGVDLLYHESTYLKEHEEKAGERFHSTAAQAATIARMAGVKRLLIGHFSSKYTDLEPFVAEARDLFPDTELAWEGSTFFIP
jgi:ribonuclease Z